MASDSDTEDGWATLAACSDDGFSEISEQSASDLQSKVDVLRDKTDLMQVHSALDKSSMESLTARVEALKSDAQDLAKTSHVFPEIERDHRHRVQSTHDERFERLEREFKHRFNSEQPTSEDQSRVDGMPREVKSLRSQSTDYKPSIDVLADSLKGMEDKAKRLEGEINERLEEQTDRVNVLESRLESLAEVDNDRIDQAIAEVHSRLDATQVDKKGIQSQIRLSKGSVRSLTTRVDALEANVERVEQENSERLREETHCVNILELRLEDVTRYMKDRSDQVASDVGAFRIYVEHFDRENKERMDDLEQDFRRNIYSVKEDLQDGTYERLKDEADLREALKTDVERLERENKTRIDNLERQNRNLQDVLGQTQRIVEGLQNGIRDALGQVDTDLSGLKQRVEMSEGSGQNGDSMYIPYTNTTLNQENRLRELEAQVYALQGYVNGITSSYANIPYGTVYGGFVPYYRRVRR